VWTFSSTVVHLDIATSRLKVLSNLPTGASHTCSLVSLTILYYTKIFVPLRAVVIGSPVNNGMAASSDRVAASIGCSSAATVRHPWRFHRATVAKVPNPFCLARGNGLRKIRHGAIVEELRDATALRLLVTGPQNGSPAGNASRDLCFFHKASRIFSGRSPNQTHTSLPGDRAKYARPTCQNSSGRSGSTP
jgi:hypothetical protein